MHENMKKIRFFIGLDLGTSAIKGVLMDSCGGILAEATRSTDLLHPQKGWTELDPEKHYRNVCATICELVATSPGKIDALAMAAASGNTLLTDSKGAPLMNIISWMDRRAEQEVPKSLSGLTSSEVVQVTGWPCVSSFPLAHLAWLRENRSELYREAGHYGMDTDWLSYRLTGKWGMDNSTATTFHLQDQVTGRYHQPFLDRLGIPIEKLSPLIPSGTVVGALTPEALSDTGLSTDTMFVSGSFDHPAAARSAGVLEPGQLLLSCGTSWVGLTPLLERQRILDAGMLCDPFLSDGKGPWAGIFSVPYIGRTIDWYVNNLIAPAESDCMRIFNESAAEASPGAGGLEIDLSLPPRKIDADRRNISRAIMEGAARLMNGKIQALKKHGLNFNRAVMVGGPSKSPIWPRIVSEITGINITVGSRTAGAYGAAMLAASGMKKKRML